MDVFIIFFMFGSAFCFQLALSIDGFTVKASEDTTFSNMQKDLLKIMNKGRRDVTPTASNMMKVVSNHFFLNIIFIQNAIFHHLPVCITAYSEQVRLSK